MSERKYLITGIALVAVGIVVAIAGSFVVHMVESPEFDKFGRALYPNVPRGWVQATVAQFVGLGGVMLVMAGMYIGWIYARPLTWARAMFGALLFTGLMFILFAVIPNQFLTLAQSTLEWTPRNIFITVPPILALNNDLSISYAALKDMISAGYTTLLLFGVPSVIYTLPGRAKKAAPPKPPPISSSGSPLRADR